MSAGTRAQRVHELGVKLLLLVLITALAFLFTRTAALHERVRTHQDAALLHRRGMAALAAGHADAALEDLRRASVRNRENTDYALSYAEALIANQQMEAADRVLRSIRDRLPEHPMVNLDLARLAARRGDVSLATRYYRYALYAPWPDEAGPRRVRDELVRLLLDHDERLPAVAELVAARATTPDTVADHRRLGNLFLEALEPRLALEEFRRAIRLDASDHAAHRGAALAAYQTGDYTSAARDFQQSGQLDSATEALSTVARAVVMTDPLGPRLATSERVRRTQRLLDALRNRILACGQRDEGAPRSQYVDDLERQLQRPGGRESAAIADILDSASELADRLRDGCARSEPLLQALHIVAERQRGQP